MWKRYVSPHKPIIDLATAEEGKVSPTLRRMAQFLLESVEPHKLDRAIHNYTSYRLWTTIPRGYNPLVVKSQVRKVSEPDRIYDVVVLIFNDGDVYFSCTCPDYRQHYKPCKHVAMVMLDLFPPRVLSLILSSGARQKYYEHHESVA